MKRKTLKTQENMTERRHDIERERARRTPFSYSIFVGLVLRDGVQIRLDVAVQNEVCISQRVVVDEVVQLRPPEAVVRHLVLYGGAIYGVNTPIREVKFHTGGICIERAAYGLFYGYILLNLMLFYPETKLQCP